MTRSLHASQKSAAGRRSCLLLALGLFFCLTACRSAFVETTIRNDGSAAIHLIEVDYPSASFGMQSLDSHSTYHYRFKIQGSGAITISWTDAAGKAHTATGPRLYEGQQGNLEILVDPSGKVSWTTHLSQSK